MFGAGSDIPFVDTGGGVSHGRICSRFGDDGMKEAKVECGIAPLERRQPQPATHTVSTLKTSSASGDAKVEDA